MKGDSKMNQDENMGVEITLTEENESSTAMYDLSSEDFAALTANATVLELSLNEMIQVDTCVHCVDRSEHWFQLLVLQNADYNFSADVCVGARLYDAYGNLLAFDNDDGEKNGFLIDYPLVHEQVYYLRVMPKLNYFMRFNTTISGIYHSPYEGSMATAQEIYAEVKANGHFSETQREQWYKFMVPENGEYTINATGDLNTIGALFDSSGCLITEQNGYTPAGSSNFRIRHYLTVNTTYYVQVREANEQSGPFTLLVTEKQLIDSISITPSKLVLDKVGTVYELPTRPNTFLNIEGTKALNDISLTVTPETVENKRVLWSSLTGNVISIENGWSNGERYYKMTVVGEGTAKLIATDPDGNGKRGECTVYVGGSPITGIDLECTKKTISVGDSEYILSTVYPPNALNKNVIWKSSNPAIAEVDDEGCVTGIRVGTTIISATTEDGNYCATCVVTIDPRERVTVKRDGEFNKIIFHTSGTEWLCLNYDMINDPENLYEYAENTYKTLRDRLYVNTYETINRMDDLIYVEDPKSYTDNEKKLLYLIDPHGFVAYVREYSGHVYRGNLAAQVNFKDSVFETLFNKSPQYFARKNNGEWYDATAMKDELSISEMLSESESFFGVHPVYDVVFTLQCIELALKLLALPTAFATLVSIPVPLGYILFLKYANLTFSLGRALIEEDYGTYIETVAKELNGMFDDSSDTKSANFDMSWAKVLFEFSDSCEKLGAILGDKPTFYREIFDYCASNPNYRILFEYNNGTIEEISDITDKLN